MKRISREKGKRNANLELLRLISMFMIVFIHANMFLGLFVPDKSRIFFNGLINGICNVGVTCFILISGYFGIRFDLKKLLKMECMMITLSLLELGVLCFFMPAGLQGAALLEQTVKSLFPFITRKYWFYSCYICIFLASSMIDKFIDALQEKEFRYFLLGFIFLFSAVPTFCYFELSPDNGKGLIQMLMIYLTGRYIRKFYDVQLPRTKSLAVLLILWMVNGLSHEFPLRIGKVYHHLCKDNSITNLVIALVLFFFFKELNLQSKSAVKLSAHLFAVFVLNNTFVTVLMNFLINKGFQGKGGILGFLQLTLVVLGIYLGCLLIGILRKLILEKGEEKLTDFLTATIKERVNAVISKP